MDISKSRGSAGKLEGGAVGRVQTFVRGPFAVGSVVWRDARGALVCTVVAKATYELAPGECTLIKTALPIQEDDAFLGGDPSKSVQIPSDLAPFKAAAEVVVVGSAFSPGERPALSTVARVIVGSVDKSLDAWTPRHFRRDGSIEAGTPATRFPLGYEHAAGGADTDNPAGIDADLADAWGRQAIPELLPPHFEAKRPGEHIPIAGFGPIAPGWRGRAQHLQEKDRAWLRRPREEALPPGFQAKFFQAAPPDQWLDRALAANERIVLEGLHAEIPRLVTSLPAIEPKALAAGAAAELLRLQGDLLFIDTDRAIATLTYRGQVALAEGAEPLRVLVVGVPMGVDPPLDALRKMLEAEEGGRAAGSGKKADAPGSTSTKASTTAPIEPFSTITTVGSSPAPTRDPLPFASPTAAPRTPSPSHPEGVLPFRGTSPSAPPPAPRVSANPPLRAQRVTAPAPISIDPPPSSRPASAPSPPASPAVVSSAGPALGLSSPSVPVPAVAQSRGGLPAPTVPAPAGAPPLPPSPPPVIAPPALRSAPPDASASPPPAAPPSPWQGSPPKLESASPPASPWTQEAAREPARPPARPLVPALRPEPSAPAAAAAPAPPATPPEPAPAPREQAARRPGDAPKSFEAAFGSAKGLSDFAAREEHEKESAARKGARAQQDDRPLRRLAVVDLLHFDPKVSPRLRGMKRFAAVWAQTPRGRLIQGTDVPRTDETDRERSDVLRVMSCGRAADAAEIRGALAESLDDLSELDLPLLLVAGELRPSFDELETLRATIAIAQPVAGPDKKVLAALAPAQEAAASSNTRPETALGLARQIEQASQSLSLPPRYVASQVERVLIENRSFKRRSLLGASRLRAELTLPGGETFLLYLPGAAAESLPLLPSFPVTAIAEIRPREDIAEAQAECLMAVAFGRVLHSRSDVS